MLTISSQQWTMFEVTQKTAYKRRLIEYLMSGIENTDVSQQAALAERVATSALDVANRIGAESEIQIARVAVILLAIVQSNASPQAIERTKLILVQTQPPIDERIVEAARAIGIAAT